MVESQLEANIHNVVRVGNLKKVLVINIKIKNNQNIVFNVLSVELSTS